MKVDRVATPLTEEQIADLLRRSYLLIFGHAISPQCLAVAWAQVCLENARGKAVHNNNLGNITTKGDGVAYYELTTDEQIQPGVWKSLTLKYRAHPDPISGFEAYWVLLRDRYATALLSFERGDPAAATYALKAARYFTANVEPYAKAMVSLYAEFVRRFSSWFAETEPDTEPAGTPPAVSDELTPVVFDVEAVTDASIHALEDGTRDQIARDMRGNRDDDKDPNA